MIFEQNVIELIQKRISVRTFADQPVEPEKLDKLKAFFGEIRNPFGAQVRLALVDSNAQKVGTYGFIKGAQTFFAGCVKKGEHDMEGFGYAFEQAVLAATALGLGTCWLGGTFKRSVFASLLKPEGEYLPAVSPLGYAAEKKTLTEKAVAAGAGARKRKRFGEIFFDGATTKPLFLEEGALKTSLEMVRIGPSASNKQPWRMIRKGGVCHFYVALDKLYAGNTLYGFSMQRIDLGIAACHFDLSARELGLPGTIVIDDPYIDSAEQQGDWRYGFSWR